jgi:biopolymer transport protein ExbB/TolQ
MDSLVTEGARLVFAQGGLVGILLILTWLVAAYLYRAQQDCADKRIEDSRETAIALERASATNAAVAAALESRTRALEELTRLMSELARQADTNNERVREKLDDVLRRMDDVQRGGRA